jgi:hypothetical protein
MTRNSAAHSDKSSFRNLRDTNPGPFTNHTPPSWNDLS